MLTIAKLSTTDVQTVRYYEPAELVNGRWVQEAITGAT